MEHGNFRKNPVRVVGKDEAAGAADAARETIRHV